MLFSMGRYNFVHRSMGRAHDSHRTPHIAITVGAIINLLVLTLMLRISETDLLGYIGLSASFGFVITYLACSVAAPVYLRLQGASSSGTIVLGAIGSILMLIVLIGSFYPVPAYPYNVLIYVFIVYMGIGAAWFVWLKRRLPAALLDIEKDLESYAYRNPYPR
jgi:amino acid transporter